MQDNRFLVSSSPHIRHQRTTGGLMGDVIFSLLPATVCGVLFFGFRAGVILLISVISCVFFEFLWQKMMHKKVLVSDLSAVVTGLILGLNLPVTVPFWIPVIGSAFSIIIVKQLFGGLGFNFMNPAAAGRAFLLASWPLLMTKMVLPGTTGFFIGADVVTSATPLAIMKGTTEGVLPSLSQMFWGNIGGCIGETSAFALLLGGIYLALRRVISPWVPLSFIGTVAVLSLLFPASDNPLNYMLYQLLGGGLFLGAIYMATDYVTSPLSKAGQIIMGVGCGAITFLIRQFGGYPEGVTYGILLMNTVTPLLDRAIKPKTFGHGVKKGVR